MSDKALTPYLSPEYTKEIVSIVNETEIISKEDSKFLQENTQHFKDIMENSYMWRTKGQKKSIISDEFHPTLHSKFHQAILEAKVQFNETFRLAVDAEMAKLEVERIQLDIEEAEERIKKDPGSIEARRADIDRREKEIELRKKMAEMNNFKTAAHYRMLELKQWKEIQDQLTQQMEEQGMSKEEIWNKEAGEIEDQFFQFLGKLDGIPQSTNASEVNNLVGLARYAVEEVKQMGLFETLVNRCNRAQLRALHMLGYIKLKDEEK